MKKRFLALVESDPECFSRNSYPGHITGSSWIISSDAEAVLLHHHRKLDIWVQLGGHADGCPDILAVALREAEEESGISNFAVVSDAIFDLDIHRIPAHRDEPEHFHYDIRFLLRAPQGAQPRCSEESKDIKWVPFDDLPRLTAEESIIRMARKSKTMLTDGSVRG